jgi:hypothetical protein
LADPAPDGTFAKLHVFTDLADAQALGFDHLSDLELEARVEGSSGFWSIHCCRHLGLKKPIVVSFKIRPPQLRLTNIGLKQKWSSFHGK